MYLPPSPLAFTTRELSAGKFYFSFITQLHNYRFTLSLSPTSFLLNKWENKTSTADKSRITASENSWNQVIIISFFPLQSFSFAKFFCLRIGDVERGLFLCLKLFYIFISVSAILRGNFISASTSPLLVLPQLGCSFSTQPQSVRLDLHL